MIDTFFVALIFSAVAAWSIGTAVLWYRNRKAIRETEDREAEDDFALQNTIKVKFTPQNVIQFHGYAKDERIEVLRLSRDGIWANPDIPADDAAQVVLNAIEANIKVLVQRAVEDEREACAKTAEEFLREVEGVSFGVGDLIRGRGM